MSVFKTVVHLLPRGKVWRLAAGTTHRALIKGLSTVGDGAKTAVDEAFVNVDPLRTTRLPQWEDQFGLRTATIDEPTRRDRLVAAWRRTGGQSAKYIQERLRGYGFDVYVHESFRPRPDGRSGGSVNGDVTPTYQDPRLLLSSDSSSGLFSSVDGNADESYDGNGMEDGGLAPAGGYPLVVNKVLVPVDGFVAEGIDAMQDGDLSAQDGGNITFYVEKGYEIPEDPAAWPHFIYIGGENFPALAQVPAGRRREFEDLCLRLCPAEKWLGILVQFV